jgi:ribosomal protein S27AE
MNYAADDFEKIKESLKRIKAEESRDDQPCPKCGGLKYFAEHPAQLIAIPCPLCNNTEQMKFWVT